MADNVVRFGPKDDGERRILEARNLELQKVKQAVRDDIIYMAKSEGSMKKLFLSTVQNFSIVELVLKGDIFFNMRTYDVVLKHPTSYCRKMELMVGILAPDMDKATGPKLCPTRPQPLSRNEYFPLGATIPWEHIDSYSSYPMIYGAESAGQSIDDVVEPQPRLISIDNLRIQKQMRSMEHMKLKFLQTVQPYSIVQLFLQGDVYFNAKGSRLKYVNCDDDEAARLDSCLDCQRIDTFVGILSPHWNKGHGPKLCPMIHLTEGDGEYLNFGHEIPWAKIKAFQSYSPVFSLKE